MKAYYNENDPGAAAWLRELIREGLIADGDVDERSICDVQGRDLEGYRQCHFFAGIGGWSVALRLAGWPDDRPVWTGSCPCQPWSDIGEGGGEDDPRHLWPSWFRLIREREIAELFGEQVASKAALRWLDGVFADLEGSGYACGSSDLCAAGVSSPHIRQRLYWVAESASIGRSEGVQSWTVHKRNETRRPGAGNGCDAGRMVYGVRSRLEGHAGDVNGRREPGRLAAKSDGSTATASGTGYWDAFDLVACRDGKTRRIEPGTFPLAHGIPARVGRLRGYGNAIVPQVAAEFIQAYLDVTEAA